MKYLIVSLVIAVSFAACAGPDARVEQQEAVSKPKAASKHSDTFNQSFERLLMSYYFLRDALVEYDTLKANAAAKGLAVQAERLPVGELTDSSGAIAETAKNYSGTIAGSALGFMGEKDILNKKKEFQMISDALYDLVRTVKYDRQKIYHQHCPMAINDSDEAYWLSSSPAIVNPYLGKKHPKYKDAMLGCGDVADTLDFSSE